MMSRILPVIFILVGIALFATYVEPTYAGPVADLQQKIASYDSALTAAQAFKTQEAKLATARSAMDPSALARLTTLLPDGVDNVQLILDLDAVAARSGMQLSDFAVSDSKTPQATAASPTAAPAVDTTTTSSLARGLSSGSPTDSFDLSVKAVGSYPAFRSFLSSVEASLRILDVVAVAVTGGENGIYTYTVTFRIYSLR